MFLQRLQRSDLCRFKSQNPRIKRTVIREIRGVADSPKEAATKLNKEDNDYENACKHQRQY